jgi:hypothetical protein
MVEVGRPVHAVADGAILHARRGPRAPRAAFVDDREDVRFALALGGRAGGLRGIFNNIPSLELIYARCAILHVEPPQRVATPHFC